MSRLSGIQQQLTRMEATGFCQVTPLQNKLVKVLINGKGPHGKLVARYASFEEALSEQPAGSGARGLAIAANRAQTIDRETDQDEHARWRRPARLNLRQVWIAGTEWCHRTASNLVGSLLDLCSPPGRLRETRD